MVQQKSKRYIKALVNLLITAFVLVIAVFVIPKVIVYFMPFVIGWIIALIANPLVRFFEEKLKIRRKAGSAFVIIAVIAAIILVGYLLIAKIIKEMSGFIATFPTVIGSLERDLIRIGENWNVFFRQFSFAENISVQGIIESLEAYGGQLVTTFGTPTVEAVSSFAKNIPYVIICIIMCVLSAYSFIAEKTMIQTFFKEHIPKEIRDIAGIIGHSIRYAIGGYFKAQLKIEIWIYLLMVVGLMILKINYAPLIAFGMAALDFFPFFGTGAILAPWAIVKFLSADYKMAIGLIIIWLVGQLVRQIIQPKYVGDSVGLPAVPTLFLLFIGYKVTGVIGMLLAVPIAIIVLDMYKSGVFDTAKNSLKILVTGINQFRRLEPADLTDVERKEAKK